MQFIQVGPAFESSSKSSVARVAIAILKEGTIAEEARPNAVNLIEKFVGPIQSGSALENEKRNKAKNRII